MSGWVIARDNPYVAVSKADGTFEIKDLPAGELEFLAWHERPGYSTLTTGSKASSS